MPSNGQRNKKKVFRRGTAGVHRVGYKTKKHGKVRDALNRSVTHGVPHGHKKSKVAKLSKTQKRPSVLLGSKLAIKNRDIVVEEAIKVKYGIKSKENVDLRLRKYVDEALHQVE